MVMIYCRMRGATSRLANLPSYGTDVSTDRQLEFCCDENMSFNMVASVDARTLPLVLLQSSRVCLLVGAKSEHHRDGSCSSDSISKMKSPCVDLSFEQLMIHLAQLQRMLVSAVAVYISYLD